LAIAMVTLIEGIVAGLAALGMYLSKEKK
jgi:hypothetical protein